MLCSRKSRPLGCASRTACDRRSQFCQNSDTNAVRTHRQQQRAGPAEDKLRGRFGGGVSACACRGRREVCQLIAPHRAYSPRFPAGCARKDISAKSCTSWVGAHRLQPHVGPHAEQQRTRRYSARVIPIYAGSLQVDGGVTPNAGAHLPPPVLPCDGLRAPQKTCELYIARWGSSSRREVFFTRREGAAAAVVAFTGPLRGR